MLSSTILLLGLLRYATAATDGHPSPDDCPCGWKDEDTGRVYTHRIVQDFSKSPDVDNLLHEANGKAKPLMDSWMIYDFWKNSDNANIRFNMKYDAQNVRIKHGELVLQQNGYTAMDHENFNPVHIAGMQSRATDILHGTFRTELKLDGYDGGSCASFFWYHDDAQELDIEVVTPGTSIVNNTINYTTQPSSKKDWTPIPGATLSVPLEDTLSTFRTHRFDCDVNKGVKYYLDDKLMHTDDHNVPKAGGSLQLKLWADGNKWWSGVPSTTDTFLRVKNIIAYYNTSTSLTNQHWHDMCHKEKKQCKAVMKLEDDKTPAYVPNPPSMPVNTQGPTACVGAMSCSTGIGAAPSSRTVYFSPTVLTVSPTTVTFSDTTMTFSSETYTLSGLPRFTSSIAPSITPPSVGGPRGSPHTSDAYKVNTLENVFLVACVVSVVLALIVSLT